MCFIMATTFLRKYSIKINVCINPLVNEACEQATVFL